MLTFSAALQAWVGSLWQNNILNLYGLSFVFAQEGKLSLVQRTISVSALTFPDLCRL